MVAAQDALAREFTAHRTHLLGVGYRLTATLADAEDAVQEAWLRLAGLPVSDRAAIRDLRGWLTTVVGRICLDRLRSATVRRERYVGPWLPEPVVTSPDYTNPLDLVVRDDGVRMAALVLLEALNAEQRVALVLHDAFNVPFTEIAETLGCSVVAARQHASRGRRAVADATPPPRQSMDEQRAVLERFTTAMATGDLDAVVRVLHPDVVLMGDGGGKAKTARRVITGVDKVSRFLFALLERYGAVPQLAGRSVLVNGDLGFLTGENREVNLDRRVTTFAIEGGRITAVYDIANPDKLTRVPF